MTIQEREDMWEDRIAQCKTSGQTKKAWCTTNNINVTGFYRWGSRIAKKQSVVTGEPARRFVLAKESETNDNTSTINISIGNAVVSVGKNCDIETLRNTLTILSEIC